MSLSLHSPITLGTNFKDSGQWSFSFDSSSNVSDSFVLTEKFWIRVVSAFEGNVAGSKFTWTSDWKAFCDLFPRKRYNFRLVWLSVCHMIPHRYLNLTSWRTVKFVSRLTLSQSFWIICQSWKQVWRCHGMKLCHMSDALGSDLLATNILSPGSHFKR